jgi:hypothetical protein
MDSMKTFNVTGKCYPEKHYMVDISERCRQIAAMVDRGDYFCINRGRQYGKTTTLSQVKKLLEQRYTVFFISFEGIGEESFLDMPKLSYAFFRKLWRAAHNGLVMGLSDISLKLLEQCVREYPEEMNTMDFSDMITELCKSASKPLVLMIDEVDQAGNYTSFIKFLSVLRDKYLVREEEETFQSVILAGVHDVKNLKIRVRPEEEHQYNSPWNIAADFSISMEFTKADIQGMLSEYEREHQIDIDTDQIAGLLYDYTAGYPFLVSRICKLMDEKVSELEGFSKTALGVQMPNITPHVCYHIYCSNMAKFEMNSETLPYLMGHSDIAVKPNVYINIGLDDVTEKLKKL